MDDRRKRCLFVATFIVTAFFALVSGSGRAQTLEYIPHKVREDLKSQFDKGTFNSDDVLRLQNQPHWTCDMYGMRTGLQVKHGVDLYEWQRSGSVFTNLGDQVVEQYHLSNTTMKGEKNGLSDELRFTKSGQLISKLTHNAKDGEKVIAFSICTATITTR